MNGQFKSLDGNCYIQIFATQDHFVTANPMELKSLAGQALIEFFSNYRVPDKIVCDGTSEQVGKNTEFMAQVCKHHTEIHKMEPKS